MTQIVEFFEAAGAFDLAPAEALAFFEAKGLKATFAWQDMLGDEHDVAFTVAKMMDTDLLVTVQGKLEGAIATGSSFADFKRDLIPTLQAAGWWGKKDMVDPLTGAVVKAQLGSASRLETIFRTNIQSAYAAGRWEQIDANARVAPWLLYDAVDDFRTRPEHAAMDGTVLPVTDPWWKTHHPPNGWNCRCGVVQLSDDELAEYGLAPKAPPKAPLKAWRNPRTGDKHLIPADLDPGWDHNPGMARVEQIKALAAEKAAALSDAAQKAALAQAAKLQAEANAAYRADLKAAQAELDAHAAGNTPYLAQAIKSVQGTKAAADLNPQQILALAKEKAAKAEASAWLSTYKKQAAAGGTISAKAQAAFDALPEADKASILADIEAKSGNLVAKGALDALGEGIGDPYLVAAYDQLAIEGKLAGLTPKKQLDLVNASADDIAAAELQALVAQHPAGSPMAKAMNDAAASVENPWDPKQMAPAVKASIAQAKLKADLEAGAKLDAIAAGNAPAQAAFQKDYLAKMSDADKLALGPVGTLAKVEEAAAVFKAGKQAAADLHGYKKKILAGKIPTDKEKAAFDALAPDKQAAFLAKLDAGTPAAPDAPPAPAAPDTPAPHPSQIAEPQPLSMANMTKTGNQKGSNTGGFYQDTTTGERYYIKEPASADIARNELLAAKLYEAAGVEVPELSLMEEGGVTRLASKIVDGITQDAAALKAGKVAGVGDSFIVDAWLGNWDVAGMGFDNLLIKGGRAVRVDVGGALRYRAQGGLKGAKWGDTVDEIESLRDPRTNSQTAAVFSRVTREDMIAGARKVLAMSDRKIDDLVDRFGPLDPKDAAALKATLKARREDIRKRYPEADETPKFEPVPPGVRVTKAEQREIVAARANGYTIPTDKDQIEDHHVVVSTYTDAQGQKRTRLVLKLRPDAAAAAETRMGIGKGAVHSAGDAKAKMLALVKGINKLASTGDKIRDKDIMRLAEARDALDKVLAGPPAGYKVKNAAGWEASRKKLLELRQLLDTQLATLKVGDAAPQLPKLDVSFAGDFELVALDAAPVETSIAWARTTSLQYPTAESRNGHLFEDGGASTVPGVEMAYTGTAGPGEAIRYIAQSGNNTNTSRGYTQIDVPGVGEDATARAFDLLDSIGINTARATEQDSIELYLERIGYLRTLRNPTLRAKWSDAGKIADIDQRVAAKLDLINKDAGFDIRTSRNWNPTGQRQAFDHGRNTFMRPDIRDADVDKLLSETIIYHNPTGLGWGANRQMLGRMLDIIDNGGQLASQMDRVRRGIASAGSSVDSDHRTGGANYVFTRLATRTLTKHAGVYWKPKQALRLDAVSYSGDRFGEVTPEVQQRDRAIGVDEIMERRYGAGGSPSNETIFRDSLSLFDDLERVVFPTQADYTKAMKELTKRGYKTWPDGRPLADVLDYAGSDRKW